MPSERRRHQLYQELKEVLSVDSADEIMEYFPPVGWADVATRADLTMIRNEMDALRAEVRGEIAEVRGEMGALRAELRGEMGALGAELRTEMGALGADLRGEMAHGFAALQRWTVTTMIAMTGLFGAIVFAAARLGQ